MTPSLKRIQENWEALVNYFVTELPKIDKTIVSNSKYICIVRRSKDECTRIQISFALEVSPLLEDFLESFQAEGSLVHVLHLSMSK